MSDPKIPRREFLGASLATAGFLALPGRSDDDGQEGLQVEVRRDVMVRMRDGVRLATDIYRPARGGSPEAGRFPVILERTPYDKSAPSRSERSPKIAAPLGRAGVAGHFVRRGYVVIYQDCRGRYRSEGEFVKYLSDGDDGYDTCAWIVNQPWSNGKIGTMGLSYAAHTQGALGCAGAPGVAAMFLDSGGFSNAYQGGIRQGGAFELKQATWAFNQALESPELARDPARLAALRAVDIRDWFRRMPWRRGHSPVSLAPDYEEYLFDQWEHGDFDGYWKQLGIYAEGFYDRWRESAMVHMSSWYDPYPRTATDNYMGLKKRKRGPVRLILGPWTHGDRQLTWAGDVDFGPRATVDGNLAPDFLTLRRRWFDRWLKGIRNGVDDEPAVRIFVMGGGTGKRNAAGRMDHGGAWRSEEDWPLPDTRWTRFYLRPGGTIATDPPAEPEAWREFRYDPKEPVPTIGGTVTSGQPVMVGGAFDQREAPRFFGSTVPGRPLAERPDVLVFQTAPLEREVELTGPLTVHLWIASDCPDTDFTAKLVDVYPPNSDYPEGFAMNLTDGILRVRYRDSWEHPVPMTPGQVYPIRIDAFPTSNLFRPGHR
ncbi:MAG TPA: CocE/NonD family hydrolase, partial [Gemmatimonadales bacterium]